MRRSRESSNNRQQQQQGYDPSGLPPQYPLNQPYWPPQQQQYPPGPPQDSETKSEHVLRRIGLAGWSALLLIPFLILLTLFLMLVFVGRPYIVHGSSMFPTLHDGDRVFVVPYRGNTTPDRGDVVVLRDVAGSSEMLIKRVVGLAGDKLTFKDNEVIVNDKYHHKNTNVYVSEPTRSILVPDNTLFVMGDNEAHSYDSRIFGPVPSSKVVGKALMIFWPVSDAKKL